MHSPAQHIALQAEIEAEKREARERGDDANLEYLVEVTSPCLLYLVEVTSPCLYCKALVSSSSHCDELECTWYIVGRAGCVWCSRRATVCT